MHDNSCDNPYMPMRQRTRVHACCVYVQAGRTYQEHVKGCLTSRVTGPGGKLVWSALGGVSKSMVCCIIQAAPCMVYVHPTMSYHHPVHVGCLRLDVQDTHIRCHGLYHMLSWRSALLPPWGVGDDLG